MAAIGLLVGFAIGAAAPNQPSSSLVDPPVTPINASLTRDEWIARADGLFQHLESIARADGLFRNSNGQHQLYFDKPTLRRIYWSAYSPNGSHIPFPVGGEAKFEAIDSNHDGRITEQEYDGFASRIFDIFARDGRLYPAYLIGSRELQALLEAKVHP